MRKEEAEEAGEVEAGKQIELNPLLYVINSNLKCIDNRVTSDKLL